MLYSVRMLAQSQISCERDERHYIITELAFLLVAENSSKSWKACLSANVRELQFIGMA